jgi:Uma2 family endonuclease
MSSDTQTLLTTEQYLEMERKSERKSELYEGKMIAMTGASRSHNRIVVNLVSRLDEALRNGPYNVYSNDMRVKVLSSGLYTYPDLIVTSGLEEKFEDEQQDTLLNPLVLIEVLSPSTEAYDRGAKFAHYQRIPSLVHYLLITQHRWSVESYTRQSEKEWLYAIVTSRSDLVRIPSIGCELKLEDIYFKVPGPGESVGRCPLTSNDSTP